MTSRRRPFTPAVAALLALAGALVLLAAGGYLLRRRSRPAPIAPPAPVTLSAMPERMDVPTIEPEGLQAPAGDDSAATTAVSDVVADDGTPLAPWARAAIVVFALLAFFAVSLLATKKV